MCLKCDVGMLHSIGGDFFLDEDFNKTICLLDEMDDTLPYPNQRDYNDYLGWGIESLRFIKSYYPSDYKNAFNIFYKQPVKNHRKIWMMLLTYRDYPLENIKETDSEGGKKSINIHNIQNNQNSVNINLIIENIKNELSASQFEEIKIIKDDNNLDEKSKKEKIIEKLKSFGSDVASNILAGILTNPSLYSLF